MPSFVYGDVFVNKYPIRNSKSMILNFTVVTTTTSLQQMSELRLNASLTPKSLILTIHAHRTINSTKWKLTPSKRLGNSRPQGQLTLLRRRKIVFFFRRPFVRTHIFAVVGDGFAVVVVPRVATAVFYVKVKAGAFYVYYVGYAVGLQGKT